MALIGIDIGTTHCKAGLFKENGEPLKISVVPTVTRYDEKHLPYFDHDEIWNGIITCLKDITSTQTETISAIGITSMAETGLLIDKESKEARTDFIPWFSRCAEEEAILLSREDNPFNRFQKTGLHNSYKYGLAKILWLKEQNERILNNAVWLSASDYIAFRLTGKFATDYSLAARTFAFRFDQKKWDKDWINHFGLSERIFPDAYPSGTIMGVTVPEIQSLINIPVGTPVAISGHDHVCASLAVGAVKPGTVFDSIGTAETLVGTLEERTLEKGDFEAGLSFGCHVVKNRMFWMGGIPSSGGSIEWFRNQFADQQLSYESIMKLSSEKQAPTGILYYPYLSGSGAPKPDAVAKAAFIGLTSSHNRADMLRAMMEGTGYELESIRRKAEQVTNLPIHNMIAVGGGTKNRHWMQIKADITNCHIMIPNISEATLLGAAITAGIGAGLYKDEIEAGSILADLQINELSPLENNHRTYKRYYETGYIKLQESLRDYYHQIQL